jgi:hypothetical protein
MHYNTFERIKADTDLFAAMANRFSRTTVMNVGDWLEY